VSDTVNSIRLRDSREVLRRFVLSTILALSLTAPPLFAAERPLMVWAGKAVGPIEIGMTQRQLLTILGPPSTRPSDQLWEYETPIKIRIELSRERVTALTTWDHRAQTGDNLRVGSPVPAVIRALGGSPAVVSMAQGLWFSNYALGMAIFVQDNAAVAFRVMNPISASQPAIVGQPPTGSRTSGAPSAGSQASAPAIVVEGLRYNVASSVQFIGAVTNVSRIPRSRVTVTVSAKTFRDVPLPDKRVLVAEHLHPGQRALFVAELEQDLVKSYRVQVDFSPRAGEPLVSISGSIAQGAYATWTREDLSRYVSVSGEVVRTFELPSITRYKLRITNRSVFPRYAKVKSIWVRVSPSGRAVEIDPGSNVTEVSWTASPYSVQLTVVRVNWDLDF
jgi:hypothetical protein